MKKKITIALFMASSFFIILNNQEVFTNTGGAPAGVTGSPGDGGATCRSCHSGPAASAQPGWITSNVPLTGYVPSNTYTITATITRPGHTKFGFEISPQNAGGTLLGTLVASPETQKAGGNSKYITHKATSTSGTGGSKSWTFNWVAPSAGTGTVTFYGAFNASNNNGNNSGDSIFTSTLVINETTCSVVAAFSASAITIDLAMDSTVTFTNQSSGAASYLWNLGNGDTSAILNPTATYNATGTYTVLLTAYDSTQTCSDTASVVITVINSVGINDFFADELSFQMYPNPVSEQMQVNYLLKEKTDVSIDIYNLAGEKIARLLSAKQLPGEHTQQLRPENRLAKGLYFLKITVGQKAFSQKLIVQ